jgi:hypothetical protein
MRANVSPDRKRLLNNLFASEALLRRAARRYFHNPHPSFFRIEHEDILESRPTRISDGAGEIAVLEQVLNTQILNCDESVSVDVGPSRLVGVVLALAGDFEMLFGRLLGCFAAAIGASLAPCSFALRPPEFVLSFLEATWVFDRAAVGVCNEVRESQVQSDCISLALFWRFSDVADDEDLPMPVGAKNEVSGLGGSFERAVLFDLQAASEFARGVETPGFGV